MAIPAKNLRSAKPGVQSDAATLPDSEFLAVLGKRVRENRERRSMARKALARDADVSERYLSQLESGDGNVSIVLLRRIALALGVSLSELLGNGTVSAEQHLIRRLLGHLPPHRLEEVVSAVLREFGVERAVRARRVALIGLRGAGKSTLGGMLAQELKLPFVELNREIERDAGMSSSEVFMLYGDSGYRRFERSCLERIIETHERVVISVGGGIVSEADTYELLLANFFAVWLKATPEEHMSRVVAQGDLRPMQGNAEAMSDLRRILAAREPLYGKADVVVDTSGRTAQESAIELRRAVWSREQPSPE